MVRSFSDWMFRFFHLWTSMKFCLTHYNTQTDLIIKSNKNDKQTNLGHQSSELKGWFFIWQRQHSRCFGFVPFSSMSQNLNYISKLKLTLSRSGHCWQSSVLHRGQKYEFPNRNTLEIIHSWDQGVSKIIIRKT